MGAVGVLVAILLGLTLLLAVPLGMVFRLAGTESLRAHIGVSWLFGLVRFRLRIPRTGRPTQPSKAEPGAEQVQATPEKRAHPARVLAVLRQAALRRRVHRLVADLARAIHLSEIYFRLRLGLGDPADTGRLWAVLGPLHAMAQTLRQADVQIEPDFLEAVCEFRARGRVRVVPLQLLILTIGFVLSPVSIRAWYALKNPRA